MAQQRSEAQKEAERRYRASKRQVLIRFTPEEDDLIASVAGKDRAAWIKAKAISAAKAKRAR